MYRPAAIAAQQNQFAPLLGYRSPKLSRYFYLAALSAVVSIIWAIFYLPFSDSRVFEGVVLSSQPSAEIRASRSGYIADVAVRSAQSINSGQTLLRIADQDLYANQNAFHYRIEQLADRHSHTNLRLSQREAVALQQQQSLKEEVELLLERAETLSARREVALMNYQIASNRHRQNQHLHQRGAISRLALDRSFSELGAELQRVAVAVTELNVVNQRVREREQYGFQIQAQLSQARLDHQDTVYTLQQQHIELSEERYRQHASPITGVVDQLLIREGEWVERGALMAIVRPDQISLTVRVWVDVDLARRIKLGQHAMLRYQRFNEAASTWQRGQVFQVGSSPVTEQHQRLVSVDLELLDWVDAASREVNDGDGVEVYFQFHKTTAWNYLRERINNWQVRL